jgi:beta-lactamase regulating signal transducer with metallopeptidase domain
MMERVILEYVANSVWQVPMLAGMAWLAIRLGRPGAQMQHRVWAMTLVLCVLLPLIGPGLFPASRRVGFYREHFRSGQRIQALGQAQSGLWSTPTSERLPSATARVEDSAQSTPQKIRAEESTTPMPLLPVHKFRLSQSAVDWLLGIYFTIILFRLAQLAFARRMAERLARRAVEKKWPQTERRILEDCCERLRVREPQVLFSGEIRTPMTVGGMRPAVLLPETFSTSTESEMAAILLHELAHVRRRDYMTNWLCQVGSLSIAYHPATHAVQRRIRRTRELVCDAMAAGAMDSSIDYARCLVALAQRMMNGDGLPQSVQAAGLFDHDVFEERILRLLEKEKAMNVRAKMVRVMGGITATAVMTIAGVAFHITPVVVRAAETKVPAAQIASPAEVATPTEMASPAVVAAPAEVVAPPGVPVVLKRPVRLPVPIPVRVTTPIRAEVAAPIKIALAVQAVNPVPAPVPAPQSPAPNVSPAPAAKPLPERQVPQEGDVILPTPRHEKSEITPEQRARMEADMAAARLQIQEATKQLQSPEFKKQMADMQAQIAVATKQMQSAEVQRQMKMLQSPEFKKQMADMQAQIAVATEQMQSAEVQRQMKMLQSPEFKKQMADMQRKIEEATRQFESGSKRMHEKEMQPHVPSVQPNPKNSVPQ